MSKTLAKSTIIADDKPFYVIFNTWSEYPQITRKVYDMCRRCYCKSCRSYKWYGARDIDVQLDMFTVVGTKNGKLVLCGDKMVHFIADNLGFKEGCNGRQNQIDRIDNNRGYYLDNMRIVDAKTNLRNRGY